MATSAQGLLTEIPPSRHQLLGQQWHLWDTGTKIETRSPAHPLREGAGAGPGWPRLPSWGKGVVGLPTSARRPEFPGGHSEDWELGGGGQGGPLSLPLGNLLVGKREVSVRVTVRVSQGHGMDMLAGEIQLRFAGNQLALARPKGPGIP